MKPAPFSYEAPGSVDEAVAMLAEHGEDASVLAGGQSLVPLLNFRMARPEVLVDINRVPDLSGLRTDDGALRIGAVTRDSALERSAAVARGWPLLGEALRHVGHPAIRNRGTVGGSAAYADPAAELPTVLAALDARLRVRSVRGVRVLEAESFFLGHLTTALEPDELLAEIEVPALAPCTGTAFAEYARLHGDFALAGAAAVVTVGPDLRCRTARLALLGVGATPVRATSAETAMVGVRIDERVAAEAGDLAARDSDPPEPQDHRCALLTTLVREAVLTAASRAEHEVAT